MIYNYEEYEARLAYYNESIRDKENDLRYTKAALDALARREVGKGFLALHLSSRPNEELKELIEYTIRSDIKSCEMSPDRLRQLADELEPEWNGTTYE